MEEERHRSLRPPPLPSPEELLSVPFKVVELLDSTVARVDEVLRRFDEVLSPRSTGLHSPHRDTGVFSPSYPGQTREDACAECLERHFAKAHGLLEEAERFSLRHGKITPEAREKIRRAVEEIVTAEDDLGTRVEDEEFRRGLDEVRALQRELRKWMWARGLTTVSDSLDDLRAAKEAVKRLLDKVYELAEKYRRRSEGKCEACEVATTARGGAV